MKQKSMIARLCLIVSVILLIYIGIGLTATTTEAATYKTYTVSTKTKPVNKKYQKNKNYNTKTKHYFMLKSYLEMLEKEGGGTLVLKKGVYKVTNTLCIPSNVTIKLSKGAILKKTSSTGTKRMRASNYLFYLVAPSKESKKNATSGYKGAKNISIIGQTDSVIDMGGSSSTAIFMAHNENVLVQGISFQNALADNYIITINGCNKVKIHHCSFSGNKSKTTGIILDIPAKGKKQTKTWVKQDDTVNKGISIYDCSFNKLYRGIASVRFVKNKYFKSVVIKGNTFKNIGSDVIRALNWDAPSFLDNRFINVGTGRKIVQGTTDFDRGIYLGGVINPVVTGNYFEAVPLPIMAIAVNNTDNELKKANPKTSNTITEAQIANMYKKNNCKDCVLPYVRIYNNAQTKRVHYYFYESANKTYIVNPDMSPYKLDNMISSTYNSYTRQYYMLQSYLNQIEANGGGTLVLTAGVYMLPAELLVGSNTTIKFEAGAIVRYRKYTQNGFKGTTGLFSLVSPRGYYSNSKYKAYSGAKNIKFVGPENGTGTIDLNNNNVLGIILCHNNNVTIEHITFTNMCSGHFIEMDAAKKVVIKNCVFKNHKSSGGAKEAINLDMPDKNTGGFVRKWTNYDKTPNDDILITNNVFNNLEAAIGSHHYTDKGWHTNVKVTNNTFDNMTTYPIKVMQWDSPIISGNTFTNIGYDRMDVVITVICMEGVKNPQVFNNVLNKCKGFIRIRVRQIGSSAALMAYPIPKNSVTTAQIQLMINQNRLIDVPANYVTYTNELNADNTQITRYYVENAVYN